MAGIALLDTHALLWALMEPHRLSGPARNVLEDDDAVVFVSSASAWELGIKWKLGKLEGAERVLDGLDRHLERLAAVPLPITIEHALAAAALPLHHRDPFDRMLIAQARSMQVPVMTNDAAFSAYAVGTLW